MSNGEGRYWSLQSPGTLPPSRKAGSMAYDTRRGAALLFGGGGRCDTWLWDGTNWHEHFSAITPPARACATMAYDAVRGHVILFGGTSRHGYPLNDTWLWDETGWHEQYMPTTPAPRSGAVMAFDEARQKVVLFGGQTYGGRAGTLLNDTWLWDGTRWHEITSLAAPHARLGAHLAYHAGTRKIILFGGTAGHTIFQDTWLWDGKAWRKAEATVHPPARAWANMVYHQNAQQIVLVGGSGSNWQTGAPLALDDTWAWDGSAWQHLPSQPAPSGSYHSATYDIARNNIVVYATTRGQSKQIPKSRDQHYDNYTIPDSETWLWKA